MKKRDGLHKLDDVDARDARKTVQKKQHGGRTRKEKKPAALKMARQ